MDKEIKGKFTGGIIEPLEELDLEEGEEVTLIVKRKVKGKTPGDGLRASRGGWKDDPGMENLKRLIYESRISGSRTPPDL
jgi:predicted DNA-binding antitoxin AbrB/MazE fold protein